MYRYQETYNYYDINLFDNKGSSVQISVFQRFEDSMCMPKKILEYAVNMSYRISVPCYPGITVACKYF